MYARVADVKKRLPVLDSAGLHRQGRLRAQARLHAVGVAEHELGRAAADVADERPRRRRPRRGDAAERHERLVVAGQQARVEAVAPLHLAEEGLAVLGVAHGARRDRERPLRAVRLQRPPVVAERDPTDATEVVVIDIGGGSTELVVGRHGSVRFHTSTQAGVVRQSERHLRHDPPDPGELAELRSEVRSIFETAVPAEVREGARGAIAVAGTATSLASIDQKLDPYDPARVHGHHLSLERCSELLGDLAGMTEDERRAVTGLDPARAPTIVAGTAFLVEALEAFGLGSTDVSDHDILRGAALEAVHRRA